MRGGILFSPFTVKNSEILLTSERDDDAYTKIVKITFELPPDEHLPFEQPQTNIKVRRPDSYFRARAYSLVSSVETKGSFSIVVKVYKGGMTSSYLGSLKIGEVAYVNKTLTKSITIRENIGLIAFGIGITEMMVTAKKLLDKGSSVKLLWSNRYKKDFTIFKDEITSLLTNKNFSIVYICSREDFDEKNEKFEEKIFISTSNVDYHKGYIDATLLNKAFGHLKEKAELSCFLAIGSKAMMRNCYQLLGEIGFHHKLLGAPNIFS